MSLNPNCSESVYRIKRTDLGKLDNETLKDLFSGDWPCNLEPTEGYSNLRGKKKYICFYYYQASADWLEKILLDLEIPYKAEKPFTGGVETPSKYLFKSK